MLYPDKRLGGFMKTCMSDLVSCINSDVYKDSFLCLDELNSRVFYVKCLIKPLFICKITWLLWAFWFFFFCPVLFVALCCSVSENCQLSTSKSYLWNLFFCSFFKVLTSDCLIVQNYILQTSWVMRWMKFWADLAPFFFVWVPETGKGVCGYVTSFIVLNNKPT